MIEILNRYLQRIKFFVFHNRDSRVVFPLSTLTDFFRRHFKFLDHFLKGPYEDWRVENVRRRYERTCLRIRTKREHGKKITVMFVVSCLQKWKCQKLYDLLKEDSAIDPVIGVSEIAFPGDITVSRACSRYAEMIEFFKQRGCKCVQLFDPVIWHNRKIHAAEADIVFLPEPWYKIPQHTIAKISKFALTAYVQYFIPIGFDTYLCQLPFHRELFRHFVINDSVRKSYVESNASAGLSMAGKIVGTGNPILDGIPEIDTELSKDSSVIIYAPHWTINPPGAAETDLKISTFLENGKFMLDYAQKHTDIKWVFKPHPALKTRILNLKVMDETEVDAYYNAWKKLGTVHETGDYFPLFMQSRAMITDCASFLNEYGATGRPIIHLISSKDKREYPTEFKAVYDTYYKVHDIGELNKALALVVEKNEDPNRSLRFTALTNSGLLNRNASLNIYNHLKLVIEGKEYV